MKTGLQAMTMDQVRAAAPSVFADRPWDGVSARYAFIPTVNVVEALVTEGWNVMAARQQKTRVEGREDFTKHVIRFRRPDGPVAVGDVFPEIVLTNSHDRGSAYQMFAGLFRLVCGNGMIVSDATFGRISVRHSGKVIDEVLGGAGEIGKTVPMILDSVKEMQAIDLSPNERGIFARAALALKYEENPPFNPTALLAPRRYGDTKTDLWATFNTIQENVIRGGIRYNAPAFRDEEGNFHPARRARTRGVNGINEDTRLNRALWTLTEEMRKLKGNH